MTGQLLIRPAVLADAGPMADVFVAAWRQAYPGVVPASVLAGLDVQQSATWLAGLIENRTQGATEVSEQAGRVTGFVRYGTGSGDPGSGYVFGLYVHPDTRGQGTGQALLAHAEEQLRARGCTSVALHVFEANERARRLYRRAGYEPDGSTRVEPEYQANEVRLVKQLAPGRFAGASALLTDGLAAGFPPAVSAEVRQGGDVVWRRAGGVVRLPGTGTEQGPPPPAGPDTLFDLASLTKVVATLPLVLLLHQRGQWSIDDPVCRWLPGAPASSATISDCLLHVAGLVPFRQYYRTAASPAELKQAVIAELGSVTATPAPVSYSDVGFMLLGWAVEECAGAPLADLFAREIAAPLGLTATGYRPRAGRTQIAATEADGDQRLTPGLLQGSVHDGNAFALGGVAGHAGLFGTAADLGRYAAALLRPDRHPVLTADTLALMTARRADSGDEHRVLGWRLEPAAWGDWPAGTLWHTGFTGTSLLVSPALDATVVLLANAVHPVRQLDRTAQFRASVHQAIRSALSPQPQG